MRYGPVIEHRLHQPGNFQLGLQMSSYCELVTVLIPSSQVPSHPSIGLVQRAITSIRQLLALPTAPVLVCCDGQPLGKDPEPYTEYKQRLEEYSQSQNVQIAELDEHRGLPGVIQLGFEHVHTPLALVFQHDVEVVRPVDVAGICDSLLKPQLQINHVRLNNRRNREYKADSVLKEYEHPDLHVPLLRTIAWSDLPHFTTTIYYRTRVIPRIRPTRSSRGVENQLGPLIQADVKQNGFDAAHPNHGTFVYGRRGDKPVIRHLDGRRSQSVEQLAF